MAGFIPDNGDKQLDRRMRPPRIRRYDKASDEWLTEDEYEYRMAKRAQQEEFKIADAMLAARAKCATTNSPTPTAKPEEK